MTNNDEYKIIIGLTQFTFQEAEIKAIWLYYVHLSALKPASWKVLAPTA
jgi:hypothetical protein